MRRNRTNNHIVVVGGGLAGLATAVLLGRSGYAVTLLEKSRHIGGRAITQVRDGFYFNLGPHALYKAGPGIKVLGDLGINFSGGVPSLAGNLAYYGGELWPLPHSPWAILTSAWLGPMDKVDTLRAFTHLQRSDPGQFQETSWQEWLATHLSRPRARQFLQAFLRLFTYTADTKQFSAGTALAQAQIAIKGNVLYLDGGWQTLVDGLVSASKEAGVTIQTGIKAEQVVLNPNRNDQVQGVRLGNGMIMEASAVILATDPHTAAALVPGSRSLQQWAAAAIPVKATCMDLALRRLPRPDRLFVLGIDQPLYLSVHSAYAGLVPQNGAVIHLMKYLDPAETHDPESDRESLTALLDQAQPGWRQQVADCRFLPHMTVANTMPTADQGGLPGRPGPAVPGIDNLYVAGDWVGPAGLLSDASLASARQVADQLTTSNGQPRLTLINEPQNTDGSFRAVSRV